MENMMHTQNERIARLRDQLQNAIRLGPDVAEAAARKLNAEIVATERLEAERLEQKSRFTAARRNELFDAWLQERRDAFARQAEAEFDAANPPIEEEDPIDLSQIREVSIANRKLRQGLAAQGAS